MDSLRYQLDLQFLYGVFMNRNKLSTDAYIGLIEGICCVIQSIDNNRITFNLIKQVERDDRSERIRNTMAIKKEVLTKFDNQIKNFIMSFDVSTDNLSTDDTWDKTELPVSLNGNETTEEITEQINNIFKCMNETIPPIGELMGLNEPRELILKKMENNENLQEYIISSKCLQILTIFLSELYQKSLFLSNKIANKD